MKKKYLTNRQENRLSCSFIKTDAFYLGNRHGGYRWPSGHDFDHHRHHRVGDWNHVLRNGCCGCARMSSWIVLDPNQYTIVLTSWYINMLSVQDCGTDKIFSSIYRAFTVFQRNVQILSVVNTSLYTAFQVSSSC